jgi:hypothetical protein
VFALILVTIAVSGGIDIAPVNLFYRAALEEKQQRLVEIAESHSRLSRIGIVTSQQETVAARKMAFSRSSLPGIANNF